MVLKRRSNSGTPSIDVCLQKASLAVLYDGLPGGVAASYCVLERGESVSSLVGWHSVIPSGIVGCGIKTWFWENRASRWLIPCDFVGLPLSGLLILFEIFL